MKDIGPLPSIKERKIGFKVIYDETGEPLDEPARTKIYTRIVGGHRPNSPNKTALEHRLMNAVRRSKNNYHIPTGKENSPEYWENIKEKFKRHVIDNALLLETLHMLQDWESKHGPTKSSFVGMKYNNLMKNAATINKALSHNQNNPNSARAFFRKVRNMNHKELYAQRRKPNAKALPAPTNNIIKKHSNNTEHTNINQLQPYFNRNRHPNQDARAAANKLAANKAAANKLAANKAAGARARAAAPRGYQVYSALTPELLNDLRNRNKASQQKRLLANYYRSRNPNQDARAAANKAAANKLAANKAAANKAAANNKAVAIMPSGRGVNQKLLEQWRKRIEKNRMKSAWFDSYLG